jgi:hypothetical protein
MDSKIEPVILGRKQLVLLLEKIAQDPYLHQFEGLRAHAARNAADARQHLWPKSLL